MGKEYFLIGIERVNNTNSPETCVECPLNSICAFSKTCLLERVNSDITITDIAYAKTNDDIEKTEEFIEFEIKKDV